MKWLFRRITVGLRFEIVVNIVILVVASLLLIGFTILKVSEKTILDQKIEEGHIILSSLQRVIVSVQSERWHEDPALSQILIGFTQLPEIEGIWVTDRNLKPQISRARGRAYEGDLQKAVEQGTHEMKIEGSGSLWWSFYQRVILTAPLVRRGQVTGAVQISFSLQDVTSRLVVLRWLLFVLILADSVVLVIFGSFLLSRVLVNPLTRLVNVAERIRSGDLDQRAEVEYGNEIGQLSIALNQMVESLAEKQRDLEATITKLKETQRELITSEKLASVGRLAAGVAHEIGNPLASVLGHTEILRRKLKDNDGHLDLVERVRRETERINRTIRDLLQFSRPPTSEITHIEINEAIQQAVGLLKVQQGFKNAGLDLALNKTLPPARGNMDQLQQVLVNILMNAADAMPNGGSISIRTAEENGWVSIAIRDSGEGISADDLDRIFDPFYTTKSPDKGTGLGLSISLRIIESFGGKIKVESDKEEGTEFTVLLRT